MWETDELTDWPFLMTQYAGTESTIVFLQFYNLTNSSTAACWLTPINIIYSHNFLSIVHCQCFVFCVKIMNSEKTIPKTPTGVAEFNKVWLKYVLEQWLNKNKSSQQKTVEITSFTANKNGLQVRSKISCSCKCWKNKSIYFLGTIKHNLCCWCPVCCQ